MLTPEQIALFQRELRRITEAGEEPAILRVVARREDGKGVDVYELFKPFPDPLDRQLPPGPGAITDTKMPLALRRDFIDCIVFAILEFEETVTETRTVNPDGSSTMVRTTEEAHVVIYGQPWRASGEKIPENWTFSAGRLRNVDGTPAIDPETQKEFQPGDVPFGCRLTIPKRLIGSIARIEPLENTVAHVSTLLAGDDEEDDEPAVTVTPVNGATAPS